VWNLDMGLIAAMLPPSGVAKLGPDWLMANSTAPGTAVPDGDGYRLSGEWKIVSGAHVAEWFLLNSIVMRDGQPSIVDGQPELRLRCVPRSQVEIRDTWRSTACADPISVASCWGCHDRRAIRLLIAHATKTSTSGRQNGPSNRGRPEPTTPAVPW
jgi:hypothetical protein